MKTFDASASGEAWRPSRSELSGFLREQVLTTLSSLDADGAPTKGVPRARRVSHSRVGADRVGRHRGDVLAGRRLHDADLGPLHGLADGPQAVILEQVANGVAVRMAVLEELLGRPC